MFRLAPDPLNRVKFWVELWQEESSVPLFLEKLDDSWFFIFEVAMIGENLVHLIGIQGVSVNIALL